MGKMKRVLGKAIVLSIIGILVYANNGLWAADASTTINFQVETKSPEKKLAKPNVKSNKIKKEAYGEYTLGKDDLIEINVRRHPEFSGRFMLAANGKIQYPFVGDISLTGMTKSQALAAVAKILTEYIETPEVDITIVAYNSKVVYVMGQVAAPGRYAMNAEFMPVRDAVLAAGLPRENIASLRRAVIIRPIDGEKAAIKKVNLLSLLYEGNLKLNYDLQSGDIVYLPSTVLWKVSTVLGQVLQPAFQATSVYDSVDNINNNNN
ncbi:MAG: polysaccharide biosynthesis/export family protein [Candidatus Omnitrophica bacterium]|nr:polysaccharide biosynthesis/export family protein [Candidatus Omnitrophota bacterium]